MASLPALVVDVVDVVDVVVVVVVVVATAPVRFFVSAPGKDNQFCDRTT